MFYMAALLAIVPLICSQAAALPGLSHSKSRSSNSEHASGGCFGDGCQPPRPNQRNDWPPATTSAAHSAATSKSKDSPPTLTPRPSASAVGASALIRTHSSGSGSSKKSGSQRSGSQNGAGASLNEPPSAMYGHPLKADSSQSYLSNHTAAQRSEAQSGQGSGPRPSQVIDKTGAPQPGVRRADQAASSSIHSSTLGNSRMSVDRHSPPSPSTPPQSHGSPRPHQGSSTEKHIPQPSPPRRRVTFGPGTATDDGRRTRMDKLPEEARIKAKARIREEERIREEKDELRAPPPNSPAVSDDDAGHHAQQLPSHPRNAEGLEQHLSKVFNRKPYKAPPAPAKGILKNTPDKHLLEHEASGPQFQSSDLPLGKKVPGRLNPDGSRDGPMPPRPRQSDKLDVGHDSGSSSDSMHVHSYNSNFDSKTEKSPEAVGKGKRSKETSREGPEIPAMTGDRVSQPYSWARPSKETAAVPNQPIRNETHGGLATQTITHRAQDGAGPSPKLPEMRQAAPTHRLMETSPAALHYDETVPRPAPTPPPPRVPPRAPPTNSPRRSERGTRRQRYTPSLSNPVLLDRMADGGPPDEPPSRARRTRRRSTLNFDDPIPFPQTSGSSTPSIASGFFSHQFRDEEPRPL